MEGGLCQSNPCVNNGICYDGIGNFICGCKPGWKGQTCDTESKFTHRYIHGLQMPGEQIAFTARPKIKSQSQIYRYGRSIFCLPHVPKISGFFDLCLHWVSVVRASTHVKLLQLYCKVKSSKGQIISKWFFGVFDFLQKTNENKST